MYPLGPVQLHDPPLIGCGPRSTTVEAELTVALDSSVQVEPPLIEMYGTIVVGVQLIVKATVVLAVRLGVSTGFTKRARSVLLRGGAGEAVDTTILFEEVFLLAIRLKPF